MATGWQSASRATSTRLRNRTTILLAVAGVIVVALGFAAYRLFMREAGSADPANVAQVTAGEAVYAEHCASCHGGQLEGQPNWRERQPNGRLPAPPHDDTGHSWHHPDQVLFEIIRDGVVPPHAPEGYESDMPAFGDVLSDQEIWAVLAFIKSRWSPEIQRRQAGTTARYEE